MKIRQAKKIMHSRHWYMDISRKYKPWYHDETGHLVMPSLHDWHNPTFQKARRLWLKFCAKHNVI